MYSNIYELPTQVTSSLSEEDAKVWMDAFNRVTQGGIDSQEELLKARRLAWAECKALPSSFSFCIKATVDSIDRDHEVVDVDSVAKHIDSYISYGGPLIFDHGNYNVGTIWGWDPIEYNGMKGINVYGNLYGGDQVYDQVREMFVKGVNNLSIAGEAPKGNYVCDDRGCYTKRNVQQLMEISLCKKPTNRYATLNWYNENASMTKSLDEILLSVEEYEVHKSERECPILGLRKSLRDIGFDAHARPEGVFIPLSDSEIHDQYPHFHENDMLVYRVGGGVIVKDAEAERKRIFHEAYPKGLIDEKGYMTGNVKKGDFIKLYNSGLFSDDGSGRYRMTR